VELSLARSKQGKKRQLEELEKMIEALAQGSGSLNQRATTLAALAAAALGAFGVFSAQMDEITPSGLSIAAAVLVGVSSIALLAGAGFALKSVRPWGRWTANFAANVESVAKGEMGLELRCLYLLRAVKTQLERNHMKATVMRRAYLLTGVALMSATASVIVVLVAVAV
jgi:hypothetical protein